MSKLSSLVPTDESGKEEGSDERDDTGDDGGHPMNELKRVVDGGGQLQGLRLCFGQFFLQSLQIHLLEQVLGLEGEHSGFVFHGLDGLAQGYSGVVAKNPLGVPSPFKDLWGLESSVDADLAVDLV